MTEWPGHRGADEENGGRWRKRKKRGKGEGEEREKERCSFSSCLCQALPKVTPSLLITIPIAIIAIIPIV